MKPAKSELFPQLRPSDQQETLHEIGMPSLTRNRGQQSQHQKMNSLSFMDSNSDSAYEENERVANHSYQSPEVVKADNGRMMQGAAEGGGLKATKALKIDTEFTPERAKKQFK